MKYAEVCPDCNYWRSDIGICKCGRLARRPYRRTLKERINKWCCQRLTGDPVHSFFWCWGIDRMPGCPYHTRISFGLFCVWRIDFGSKPEWEWSWNKD